MSDPVKLADGFYVTEDDQVEVWANGQWLYTVTLDTGNGTLDVQGIPNGRGSGISVEPRADNRVLVRRRAH